MRAGRSAGIAASVVTATAIAAVASLAGCGAAPTDAAPSPALEVEVRALGERLDRIEEAIAGLHRKVDALAARPADAAPPPGDPGVPPEPPPPPARGTLKGTVLAADDRSGIYLVSLGTKDGLKAGDDLTVHRGDTFVAVVVVDKPFADKASVVVKEQDGRPLKNSPIRQGDRVATIE